MAPKRKTYSDVIVERSFPHLSVSSRVDDRVELQVIKLVHRRHVLRTEAAADVGIRHKGESSEPEPVTPQLVTSHAHVHAQHDESQSQDDGERGEDGAETIVRVYRGLCEEEGKMCESK